jgi:hypothetical protein
VRDAADALLEHELLAPADPQRPSR